MSVRRFSFALTLIMLSVHSTGCTKVTDQAGSQVSLGREDADFMIVIALDLSGSFAHRMTKEGKGYDFTMRVCDLYFRNSIGTTNRIIITQLSATDRALLWDGTPVQLRQDFPTAESFCAFLQSKSDPRGSRLHDGVADALDYVLSDQGVASGKTKAALFALSDFDDNAPNPELSEKRLVKCLTGFAKTKGIVGFYFLDHIKVPLWRRHLRESGVKQWVCESEIVAYPPLPSFE
jgi:hypothetical protein